MSKVSQGSEHRDSPAVMAVMAVTELMAVMVLTAAMAVTELSAVLALWASRASRSLDPRVNQSSAPPQVPGPQGEPGPTCPPGYHLEEILVHQRAPIDQDLPIVVCIAD